jgi:hypothetical protein
MIWSCWDLKREVSRALTRLLGDHGRIDCMSIAANQIPKAVHPFNVPVLVEGLLFSSIKDSSVVDCIHQRAVVFPENRSIKVKMKMKYNSMSMEEFPEILKEPMGGECAKGDKGLGKDISAKSNLNLNYLTPATAKCSQRAPRCSSSSSNNSSNNSSSSSSSSSSSRSSSSSSSSYRMYQQQQQPPRS